MYRVVKLFPLLLLAALFGCGLGDGGGNTSGAPVITSFTASQSNVAAGTTVTLNWAITGSPTSLTLNGASVNGTDTTVTPTVTTTYTLTATNSSGSDDATTTVTVDGTGPVTPPPSDGSRTVSFGVSGSQTGPFQSDAGSNITSGDSRIVNVSAGDTFYAQLTYSGPSPVTGVTIYLANSSPAGFRSDLVQGTDVNGFTLNEAVGSCVTDGTQTSVTCIYPVDVAEGTPNITDLDGVIGEFAYVLRTRVTDTTGTVYDQPPRGYVTVGGSSGGGTPNPPTNPDPPMNPDPPTSPNPPSNEAPKAVITVSSQDNLVVKFSSAKSSDSDGSIAEYAWDFGDDKTSDSKDVTHTYTEADTYTVKLKVTDNDGETNTATQDVTVSAGSVENSDPTVSIGGEEDREVNTGVNTSLVATGTDADGNTPTYQWSADPSAGVTFSAPTAATTDVKFADEGEYTVTVTVSDGEGGTDEDTVSFEVEDETSSSGPFRLQIEQPGDETGEYGNVQLEPEGEKCGIGCNIYDANAVITLTAVTEKGSRFVSWEGECRPAGSSTTCDLVMDEDKDVIANFIKP